MNEWYLWERLFSKYEDVNTNTPDWSYQLIILSSIIHPDKCQENY